MAQMHRVYFLGNLTRNPEVRYAPNGMAVARCGVAVPTRIRQGDTWHADVCCIDVVAFGPQAETVGTALRKGRGVLIGGRLQGGGGPGAGGVSGLGKAMGRATGPVRCGTGRGEDWM